MKEAYESPEMEVVEFETEDIITASNELSIMLYNGGDWII